MTIQFAAGTPESAQLCGAGGEPLVLQSVKASGHLSGLLLSMTLRQVFRNDQPQNLEVTYTFPLPHGAVLTGLEVELAGQRMSGEVQARAEAREHYENAVEKGDAPVMVEKSQKGLFTASLGSLKPGEEAVVEVRYAQLLSFEQGRVRLVVPTTIAPRYGSAEVQGGMLPHQVAEPDSRVEHAFCLELRLTGPVAQAHISSPTHSVAQKRVAHKQVAKPQDSDEVCIELRGRNWLDRDFVLLMEGLQGQTLAVAGADEASGPRHQAIIVSACPRLSAAEPAPLAMKILVDCSGSMSGDSMSQARKALRALASSLSESDRFTYSRFGHEPLRVLAATVADAVGVRKLVKACNETEADLGGTEIHAAMADTFELSLYSALDHGEGAYAQDASRAPAGSDILLITDGEVWDVQRIIDQAAASGHRVYALGVGSAPAESLLREMAEASGGAVEFVTPGEDMVQAVRWMVSRMRSVRAVSVRLTAEHPPTWSSALPKRLHDDETVHTHLRFDQPITTAPALSIEGVLSEQASITHVPGDLVARLVAARQLNALRAETDIQALALKYQLVSDHTNLLLIVERAESEKTDGMPALYPVRPMTAAGWGGYGSVSAQQSSIPAMYAGLGVPSVWRKRDASAKVSESAASAFDQIEVPSFLRRSDTLHSDVDPASSEKRASIMERILESIRPQKEVLPTLSSQALDHWGCLAVKYFNRAFRPGMTFRQLLQPVVTARIDQALMVVLYEAGQKVGGSQAAWACFLLWLHEKGRPDLMLSDDALSLVQSKASGITDEGRQAAKQIFDDAEKAAWARDEVELRAGYLP